jgi:hypothetical protein
MKRNLSKMFLHARRALEFSHGLDPKRTIITDLISRHHLPELKALETIIGPTGASFLHSGNANAADCNSNSAIEACLGNSQI